MPQDNAADRLTKQMRYARSLDPMERADAERAIYYAAFDRCVATLPDEKAATVDLLRSYCDREGNWELRDVSGGLVAEVRDPSAPPKKVPEKKPNFPPARKGLTPRERSILRAVGRRINAIDKLASEAITALADRVKALETNTTLKEIAERVEAIEQRGFRFVGKYQAPASYTTGDVVSYRGALWNCVASAKVGERPNTASHKWTLMIAGTQE